MQNLFLALKRFLLLILLFIKDIHTLCLCFLLFCTYLENYIVFVIEDLLHVFVSLRSSVDEYDEC